MSYNKQDIEYMQRAISLAKNGAGFVNPNPMVGCVIVKDGDIIGEGFHEYYGGLHAERNAIKNCKSNCNGATLYVTLEPCCHHGKTPPCTDIIIEKGIKKVVIGLLDPNPLVNNKGVQILKNAGIEVISGVEENEIRELNKVFIKYIKTKRPYVLLKTAMTLDGKIASYTGDSKWITNEKSRNLVHKLRSEMMGIIVGIGTVKCDDPLLNSRLNENAHQPIRIIVDTKASISVDCQLVTTSTCISKTIIAHTKSAPKDKILLLNSLNVENLCCDELDNHVDINDLMNKLGEKGIDSLLLEGGASLNAAFLQANCIDEIYAFIAPKIIGGECSKSPIGGKGIELMKDAINLNNIVIDKIDDDILIKGNVYRNN